MTHATQEGQQGYPSHEVERMLNAGPISEDTYLLLSDKRVEEMHPYDQGAYILDRVVGNVAAQYVTGAINTLTDSKTGQVRKSTPPPLADVLTAIREAANAIEPNASIKERAEAIKGIPAGGGLRAAVDMLLGDPRTRGLLTAVGDGQWKITDEHGQLTFRTLAQLQGYVQGASGNKRADWHSPLLKGVADYASNSSQSAPAPWNNAYRDEMLDSPVIALSDPAARRDQQVWDSAVREPAEKSRVDMAVVARTAEEIKRIKQINGAGAEVGRMAVNTVIPPPPEDPYAHLFER